MRSISLLLWKRGNTIIVPNTFAFFHHESDLLAINRNDYASEFEIKTTRANFKKDFEKVEKHLLLKNRIPGLHGIPNYFWFATPPGLIQPEEVPEYAGLIEAYRIRYQPFEVGRAKILKRPKRLHNQKVDQKVIRRMLVSMSARWLWRNRIPLFQEPEMADYEI